MSMDTGGMIEEGEIESSTPQMGSMDCHHQHEPAQQPQATASKNPTTLLYEIAQRHGTKPQFKELEEKRGMSFRKRTVLIVGEEVFGPVNGIGKVVRAQLARKFLHSKRPPRKLHGPQAVTDTGLDRFSILRVDPNEKCKLSEVMALLRRTDNRIAGSVGFAYTREGRITTCKVKCPIKAKKRKRPGDLQPREWESSTVTVDQVMEAGGGSYICSGTGNNQEAAKNAALRALMQRLLPE